jgi:hypothetical protein
MARIETSSAGRGTGAAEQRGNSRRDFLRRGGALTAALLPAETGAAAPLLPQIRLGGIRFHG